MERRKEAEDWRKKFHPAFFEVAEANRTFEIQWRKIRTSYEKRLRALPADSPERKTLLARREKDGLAMCAQLDETLADISVRYPTMPDNPLAWSYLQVPSESPAYDPTVQYQHWARHGEPLHVTAEQHRAGNIEAWRKLARTEEDRLHVTNRDELNKAYQGDFIHRQFLELILNFQILPLTAEERAACADAYCGCGRQTHDADVLKKIYNRLRRELAANRRALDDKSRAP